MDDLVERVARSREDELYEALYRLVEHIDACEMGPSLMEGCDFNGPYEIAAKLVGWTIPIDDEQEVDPTDDPDE